MPVPAYRNEGAGRHWGIGAEECVREGRSSEGIQWIRKVKCKAPTCMTYSESQASAKPAKSNFLGIEFYPRGGP